MEDSRLSLRVRLTLAAVVAAVAGLQLRHFLTWTPEALTEHGFLTDDAFFYSVLASNLHDHGFFTLDGVLPTNGFQPLWMGIQVVLHGFLPGTDAVSLVTASSWVSYVLFAFLVSLLVARGPALAAGARLAVFSGLVTLNVGFHHLVVTGLEVPITLALLVAALLTARLWIDAAGARDGPPWPETVLLALLAAACFFARTDLFWVAALLAAWLAFVRRAGLRTVLTFCAIVAVPVLAYLAWNLHHHGALVPISGRVKAYAMDAFLAESGGSYWATDEWRGLFEAFARCVKPSLGAPGPVFVPLVIGLVLVGQWVVWRDRARHGPAVLVLSALVAGHLAVMYGLYRELRPYTAYYFAPEVVWIGLLAAEAAGTVVNAGRRVPRSAALVVALTVLGLSARGWRGTEKSLEPSPYWVARVAMARAMVPHLELPGRVGAFWPGVFAQFGVVAVTPLDGVIGSDDFFKEHVKRGTELDYLRAQGCRDVVLYLPEGPAELLVDTPPAVANWNELGRRRLWERRDGLRVVHAEPFGENGEGWYLLRIE